jgi:hypothetical protein
MVSPLTDGWHDLRSTLRGPWCLREPEVTDSEPRAIEDCLRAVELALANR